MEQSKEYCTQDGGDCSACPLALGGRDCRGVPIRSEKDEKNDLKSKAILLNFGDRPA
jgi:hypothetical protein